MRSRQSPVAAPPYETGLSASNARIKMRTLSLASFHPSPRGPSAYNRRWRSHHGRSLQKKFLFACTVLLGITLLSAATAVAGPTPKCKLDVPTVTCIGSTPSSITLQICAGASGAPGGISIHWSTCAQYAANGNTIPDPSGGGFAISLSGNCQQSGSTWNLASGRCKTIVINGNTLVTAAAEGCGSSGNTADLACATCYVFQVFAHEDPGVCNKSDLSAAQFCNTAPCPEGNCTLTWGFWKTHGPAGCNPPGKHNLWPASTLTTGECG